MFLTVLRKRLIYLKKNLVKEDVLEAVAYLLIHHIHQYETSIQGHCPHLRAPRVTHIHNFTPRHTLTLHLG